MARARSQRKPPAAQALELRRRACLSIELGNHAMMPSPPLEFGPACDVACELYRESIHWALAARVAWLAPPPAAGEGATVWEQVDRDFVLAVVGNEAAAEELQRTVQTESFADFAKLSPNDQHHLAQRLRRTAEELVDHLDPARGEVQGVWLRRAVTLLVAVGVAVGATLTVAGVVEHREQARNLAEGKPWTASSKYPEFGCASPEQHCSDSQYYFFHTNEEQDPWLEIDLQKAETFSGLRVVGRPDCCNDRIVPLVIQVSSDREHWTEVARRTTQFHVWKPSFAPVSARWVKLHVPRRTMLHLQEVRVLR